MNTRKRHVSSHPTKRTQGKDTSPPILMPHLLPPCYTLSLWWGDGWALPTHVTLCSSSSSPQKTLPVKSCPAWRSAVQNEHISGCSQKPSGGVCFFPARLSHEWRAVVGSWGQSRTLLLVRQMKRETGHQMTIHWRAGSGTRVLLTSDLFQFAGFYLFWLIYMERPDLRSCPLGLCRMVGH